MSILTPGSWIRSSDMACVGLICMGFLVLIKCYRFIFLISESDFVVVVISVVLTVYCSSCWLCACQF